MKCCSGGVESEGPTNAQIMIVGHQPGAHELKLGLPFKGPNGEYLDACLEAVGIARPEVYLTNISCGALPSPSPACATRFASEIATVKPKLIITLGVEAAQYFEPKRKLGTIRGVPRFVGTRYIMSTWQPISVVHGKYDFIMDVLRDFSKIKTILANQYQEPSVNYEFVNEPTRAQEILDSLPKDRPIALDIETASPSTEQEDVFESPLLCFAINDGSNNFVFDVSVLSLVTFPIDIQWLFHNGPFDSGALKLYHNIDLPIVEDTMMRSYALDERQGYHRLKVLGREYCFADFWEEDKSNDLHKYNAFDVSYTSSINNLLTSRCQEEDVEQLYRNLLIPASNASRDWQVYGAPVDHNTLRELTIEWIPRLAIAEARLANYALSHGYPTRLNVNSPKQLSIFIYQILGLPDTHNGSTNKEALFSLSSHEFVQQLQAYRQLFKVVSVNVVGLPTYLKFDGRLHPQPYIHGTTTGRFSYHDPNVQNIPQKHTVGDLAVLRRMYIPSDPDHVIMEADYTQIEFWLAAGFSGDSQMLEDLQQPFLGGKPDAHGRVCNEIFNLVPQDPMWDSRRFQTKKINFGNIYDEGAGTLADPITGIGCSLSEAQRFINTWRKRYPTFVDWRRSIHKEVSKTGFIVSPFGRKRRLPLILDHRQLRQAANFPIQSAASDYTLISAIKLNKPLQQLDSHILFLVHDSIVIDASRRHLEEVKALVEEVMTEQKVISLPPVKIETKTGPNWYDVR